MHFSMSEIILILLIALLVIKPNQLPEISRALGSVLKKVRHTMNKMIDALKHE